MNDDDSSNRPVLTVLRDNGSSPSSSSDDDEGSDEEGLGIPVNAATTVQTRGAKRKAEHVATRSGEAFENFERSQRQRAARGDTQKEGKRRKRSKNKPATKECSKCGKNLSLLEKLGKRQWNKRQRENGEWFSERQWDKKDSSRLCARCEDIVEAAAARKQVPDSKSNADSIADRAEPHEENRLAVGSETGAPAQKKWKKTRRGTRGGKKKKKNGGNSAGSTAANAPSQNHSVSRSSDADPSSTGTPRNSSTTFLSSAQRLPPAKSW